VIGTILFFLLAVHLSIGILASLLIVPRAVLSNRFFRFNATVSLCVLGLGTIVYLVFGNRLGPQSGARVVELKTEIDRAWPWLQAAGGLSLVYLATLPFRRAGLTAATLAGATLAGAVFLVSVSSGVTSASMPAGSARFVLPLDFVLSSLALGSVVVCMILGHWYLVEPGMSVRPLRRTAALFIGAVAARTLAGGFTSVLVWNDLVAGLLAGGGVLDILFFCQRVLFGLALPLALSWMIWQTVKIRSTQSATGILYVAVVFVLFGEFLSHYLLVSTGYAI